MEKKVKIYDTPRIIEFDIRETFSESDIDSLIIYNTNREFPFFVNKKEELVVDLMVNTTGPSTPIIFVDEINKKLSFNEQRLTKIMKL
jgi:hypothetical protein